MSDTYVCAGCGLSFRYGDHAAAEAEAAQNGFDPEECLVVCDGCFDALRDMDDVEIAVPTLN